jgi:SMODS and SLOG-associating 2TM effector domain 1
MSREAPKHTKEDLEFLFKVYLQKRVDSQSKFYENRVRENELNSDATFTTATFVMTLSSLFATIGASDSTGSSRWLIVLSAILPAFAALLSGFRQLYGWDRQVSIYRSAKLGLDRAALIVPDNDLISESDIGDVYPRLIASTELVLTNEVNQWGQFLLDKEKQNEQQVERIEVIDAPTQQEQVRAYSQTDEMQAVAADEQSAQPTPEPIAPTVAAAMGVFAATEVPASVLSTNGTSHETNGTQGVDLDGDGIIDQAMDVETATKDAEIQSVHPSAQSVIDAGEAVG